ncbi:MAG: hypothetical protein COU68_00530 [Candidatus Pacebacteria bacterium CG10_big_fil_rev_8_21_14_0_10_45_6]|nr:MAG: hypothetical protein COU68_00530 [Candidatus Pacebacteria bacterium CG10_big_fil_rev_8_21_14_0_10_45_6]
MFGLFGTKGRIETLFRIYRAAKQKFPNASEQELLEIVVGEHIPPGKSTQLRNLGISGKQYLDGVFESKLPDIDGLIYHVITLEFPKKYKPFKINLEEITEQNRTGKLSAQDELKMTIKNCHEKFLG